VASALSAVFIHLGQKNSIAFGKGLQGWVPLNRRAWCGYTCSYIALRLTV
jgi:hypothetical protein